MTTYPKRWWALGALAISLLTIGLDLTILNVAIPTLATDLRASTSELQWFANAYTLVLAALLLPAGLLGDRYGQKKLLLGALTVFGLASLGCAYASTPELLIAARAALGIGAAFLIPLSMSLISVLFTAEERPRALTLWVMATFLGIPLGPLLGGWLLDNFWWGSVFLINVPLVVIGVIAVLLWIPGLRGSRSGRIDGPGIALSSAGLGALTYGFVEAGERGWTDSRTLLSLAAGAVLMLGFAIRQRRATDPLVDPAVFGSRQFTWGAILATVASFALMGLMFVLPQFFSAIQGTDAFGSGLRLLPLIGGMMVASKLAEWLAASAGAKLTVGLGFGLLAVGLALGAFDDGGGYGFTAIWVTVVGLGTGFCLPPLMNLAMSALTASREGSGSAMIQALRQVGGTIGVAILGTVLNGLYRYQVRITGLPEPVAEVARHSAAEGVVVARAVRDPALAASVRAAFLDGMAGTFWVCAGFAVAGLLLTLAFLPRRAADRSQSGHAVSVAG